MKIHMDIANGYRDTKISQIRLDNPSWGEEQAITHFVDDVYSSWIRANISDDFAVVGVTGQKFCIDFTYEDDANAFRRQVGGRVVED